jgi:hypothetical protein
MGGTYSTHEEIRIAYRILIGKSERNDHLRYQIVGGRIILK